MRIVVSTPNDHPDTWFRPLKAGLKDHEVFLVDDVSIADEVEIAILGWDGWNALKAFQNLRFVQTNFMGVDALLSDTGLLGPSVTVARMVDPGMPVSMAESVLAHVLFAHRQLDIYARQARRREWIELHQPLANKVTVGVLGLGKLGTICAQSLMNVGFRVVGWSRRGEPVEGVDVRTDVTSLLQEAQILVNLLPLTPATIGILCARTFSQLPPSAVVINVARGGHIVDNDLISALDSGHIRHAILDVFNREPLPSDHPFWAHEHVTVLPHIASASQPQSCLPIIVDNVLRFARGEKPLYLVDRALGY